MEDDSRGMSALAAMVMAGAGCLSLYWGEYEFGLVALVVGFLVMVVQTRVYEPAISVIQTSDPVTGCGAMAVGILIVFGFGAIAIFLLLSSGGMLR